MQLVGEHFTCRLDNGLPCYNTCLCTASGSSANPTWVSKPQKFFLVIFEYHTIILQSKTTKLNNLHGMLKNTFSLLFGLFIKNDNCVCPILKTTGNALHRLHAAPPPVHRSFPPAGRDWEAPGETACTRGCWWESDTSR